MNPTIPVASNAASAQPTRAGADVGETGKSDDAPDQARELDVFLQLLLGLAPAPNALPPPGVALSGNDAGLPPGGKKLPPAAADAGQAALKFGPALPLTQVLALSAGAGDGAQGLAERVENALRQVGVEQKSIAAALEQLVQGQATPGTNPAPPAAAAPGVQMPQPMAMAPTTSMSAPTPAHAPPVPVGSPDFGATLAGRVQWMARNDLQFARIDLSPAHLGPLEIHIHLDGDKAQVVFGAHHAVTREALEAAVPRLRGMLGDSGLQLVQVNVGQQGMPDRGRRPFTRTPGTAVSGVGPAEAADAGTLRGLQTGLREGLVDDYA